MNGFLHSRCDLVPRRVRHAYIEHRSTKSCKTADDEATSTDTGLTYCYSWLTLLPWPGPLEQQAERDVFSQQYLAVRRAPRGYLCGVRFSTPLRGERL